MDFNIKLEEEKEDYVQENQGTMSVFGRSYSFIEEYAVNRRDDGSVRGSVRSSIGVSSSQYKKAQRSLDCEKRAIEQTE